MSNDAQDQDKARTVFRETIELLEEAGLHYAVGGGISTEHWTGGAEQIGDIDLVIRESDVPDFLRLLEKAGYETTETEHSWLHKASLDGVGIDLMFELKNGTRFDERFQSRLRRGELFGTRAWIISPEDQVASLVGTVDRVTVGHHWYNIIDIMANNDLDWDYVVSRSQHIPFRMLSVVSFALSENVPVQRNVTETLLRMAAEGDPTRTN